MSQPSEAFRPLFERAMVDKGVFLNDHLEKVIDIAEEASLRRDVRIMYRLIELMQTFGTEPKQDVEQILRESGLGDPDGAVLDDDQDAAIHRLAVIHFGGDAGRLRDYLNEQWYRDAPGLNVVPLQRQDQPIPPPSQRPADPLFEVVELLETAAGKITDVSVLLSRAAQEIRKTL